MSNHNTAPSAGMINLPVVDIFDASASDNVGNDQHVSFHPSQRIAQFDELCDRLMQGWRFTGTPGYGYCGVWSLLLGLDSWMQRNGRAFNGNDAWSRLEEYFMSQKYMADAMSLMYQLPDVGFDELQHQSFFSNLQLQLFAGQLADLYLAEHEDIDLLFVWQNRFGQPQHFLQRYDLIDAHKTPISIFIHAAGNHYQAFTSSPMCWTEATAERVFDHNKPHWSDAPRRPKQKHEHLPDGLQLLWLRGLIDEDASGSLNTCRTPITNRQLNDWFKVNGDGVIRHRIMTARDAYKKKYGEESVRDDEAGKLHSQGQASRDGEPQHGNSVPTSVKLSLLRAMDLFEAGQIIELTSMSSSESLTNSSGGAALIDTANHATTYFPNAESITQIDTSLHDSRPQRLPLRSQAPFITQSYNAPDVQQEVVSSSWYPHDPIVLGTSGQNEVEGCTYPDPEIAFRPMRMPYPSHY